MIASYQPIHGESRGEGKKVKSRHRPDRRSSHARNFFLMNVEISAPKSAYPQAATLGSRSRFQERKNRKHFNALALSLTRCCFDAVRMWLQPALHEQYFSVVVFSWRSA